MLFKFTPMYWVSNSVLGVRHLKYERSLCEFTSVMDSLCYTINHNFICKVDIITAHPRASLPLQVLALDNWSGAVVWSAFLPSVRPLPASKLLLFLQRTVAHFPHPAQMALVAMQKVCSPNTHLINRAIEN